MMPVVFEFGSGSGTRGIDERPVRADWIRILKTGTTLVRQWRGHTHTLLVHEDGFEYEGQRYRSLRVIAQRITGADGPAALA